jgi:hypothetical protein
LQNRRSCGPVQGGSTTGTESGDDSRTALNFVHQIAIFCGIRLLHDSVSSVNSLTTSPTCTGTRIQAKSRTRGFCRKSRLMLPDTWPTGGLQKGDRISRDGAERMLCKINVDNYENYVNFANDMAARDQKQPSSTDMGLKLVSHSKSTEFTANRGLVIELFPFIFEASQRMSARAISRFLLEEQGVKLSAVTITKALNDPKKSWNVFFDTIEPYAKEIANWGRMETLKYLFAARAKYEQWVDNAIGNPLGRFAAKLLVKGDIPRADKILRQKWFCINIETRQKAQPYLEDRLAVWMEKEKAK